MRKTRERANRWGETGAWKGALSPLKRFSRSYKGKREHRCYLLGLIHIRWPLERKSAGPRKKEEREALAVPPSFGGPWESAIAEVHLRT
jgi:hypothetical protein